MKNKILVLMMLGLFMTAMVREPIADTADIIAGATSDTYQAIDIQSGATLNGNHEDDDEYEDEYEYEDDEHEEIEYEVEDDD